MAGSASVSRLLLLLQSEAGIKTHHLTFFAIGFGVTWRVIETGACLMGGIRANRVRRLRPSVFCCRNNAHDVGTHKCAFRHLSFR